MLTKYGNESICINIPYKAIQDLGNGIYINNKDNFANFVIPKPNTGIYLIHIDILLIDPELFWKNEMVGNHLHAFLMIYDSNTNEYQLLSASNGSYMLKEFYYGQLMNCDDCDLSKFDNTCDLLMDRKRKVIDDKPIYKSDVDSFYKYAADKSIRSGNNFNKIVELLKSISSSFEEENAIYVRKGASTYNSILGFDDIHENILAYEDSYFLHTIRKSDNCAFYIRYGMVKYNHDSKLE